MFTSPEKLNTETGETPPSEKGNKEKEEEVKQTNGGEILTSEKETEEGKDNAETSSINSKTEEGIKWETEWKGKKKEQIPNNGEKKKEEENNPSGNRFGSGKKGESKGEKEKNNYEMHKEFWENLGAGTREQVVNYKKENNLLLSEERKKSILNILEEEKEYKFQNLAREWAKKHEDELKREGLKGGDPVKLFSQAVEEKYGSDWGVFLESASKSEGDYGERVREYINIFAVNVGFEKNPDNPDNQYGALYFLQKKAERLEKKMGESTKEDEKKEMKSQLDELYEDQSGLIKGIKGLDILKDTKKNLPNDFDSRPKPGGESESIINKKLSDFKEENKGKPLKENFYNLVNKLGYKIIEKKGFKSLITGHRLEIIDDKGEKLTWPGNKEVIGGLNVYVYRLLLDRYKEKLTREQGIQYMYKERVRSEARGMVKSLSKAEEGVESLYSKIKNELVLDFVRENLLKGSIESLTNKRKLREQFESKGKSDAAFVEKGREIKSELTGEWEDDSQKIMSYLNGYAGTDLDESFLKGGPEIKDNYEKLFKKGKISIVNFLNFVLKVIFSSYEKGLK